MLSFAPDAAFCQVPGVLQGGTVATMLDFAMSFAALAVINDTQRVTTTSLAVTYLRSARIAALSQTFPDRLIEQTTPCRPSAAGTAHWCTGRIQPTVATPGLY